MPFINGANALNVVYLIENLVRLKLQNVEHFN